MPKEVELSLQSESAEYGIGIFGDDAELELQLGSPSGEMAVRIADERPVMTLDVSRPAATVSVVLHTGLGGGETYRGDYEVTPTFSEQTLFTRSKLMTDDVTVHAIPLHQTTNKGGGYTAWIGGIFDGDL